MIAWLRRLWFASPLHRHRWYHQVVYGEGVHYRTGARVVVDEAFVVCVKPSDHVTVQGPIPVKFACNWTKSDSPLQIVCDVTNDAVGRGFTVTRFVPMMSPDQFRQEGGESLLFQAIKFVIE